MKKRKLFVNWSNGFTLIEILVVMAIMAILTTIAMTSFRNVQIKARDAQRKSDLGQLQRALELYFNDYGKYPTSSGGLIDTGETFEWKTAPTPGVELTDGNTTYMKEMVGDPTSNPNYCYDSSDGTYFKVYARLENQNDPKIGTFSCNGVSYNFEVTSPNPSP